MRFHFVKQLDAMQCGVACLAMICKYYKNAYSIEALSKLCSVSTEGVSLFAIKNAAEKIGFNSVYGKASIEQLVTISLPCILHWNQNHFVVLYKVKSKKKFYLYDEDYEDYVLDYYGIREWVESLPKRKISMMILQNYTIIGL